MTKRIFSTVCLWALILSVLYFFQVRGGVIILILAALGTQFELYKLMQKMGYSTSIKTGMSLGAMMLIGSWLFVEPRGGILTIADLLLLAMVILLAISITSGSLDRIKHNFVPASLAILYIPFVFCFPIVFVKNFSIVLNNISALIIVIWIVAVSKFSDVGGLIVGCSIGKHKLMPEISPKKTYEGMLGGILCSVSAGVIIFVCFREYFPANFGVFSAAIIACILSLLALLGDLLESAAKRFANEKDSGSIIPGIGGIFDLTDSLIFTLPVGTILINFYI